MLMWKAALPVNLAISISKTPSLKSRSIPSGALRVLPDAQSRAGSVVESRNFHDFGDFSKGRDGSGNYTAYWTAQTCLMTAGPAKMTWSFLTGKLGGRKMASSVF